MTFALARSLLLSDAVTPESLAQALMVSATRGISLVRALLATRAIDPARLEQQLERSDAPYMRHVAPVMSLVQQLPPGLCERLLALPVRRDPRTGTVDVAVVDARDPHPVEEVAHWLRAPVRTVRTSIASMDAALRRLDSRHDPALRTLSAPIWVPPPVQPRQDLSETPAYGSRVLDGARLVLSEDDGDTSDVIDLPVPDPNIPFALTRKAFPSVTITELGPPAIEKERIDVEPVLDLRRRKTGLPEQAPNAPPPPFADAGATLDAIRDAEDRDSVLELLVTGTQTAARKIAVLALRRDVLVGWTCSPEFGDRNALRTVRIIPTMSDVLSVTLESDTAHLARIPKDGAHAPLLAVLKTPFAAEVALVSIRLEGKAVAVLLADELGDALLATRRMEQLAQVAGEALARLLRDKRKA